jgi:hypothetical protein
MNFAKKMLLISPDALDRLKSTGAEVKSHHSLENQMTEVLANKNIDDNEKWRHFEQMLQSFVKTAAKAREPIHIPIIENYDSREKMQILPLEQEIKSSMGNSKTLNRNASQLLDYLRKSPHISWDNRGIVQIQGRTLPNSNIIDLVNDALKSRKSDTSDGWHDFAYLLAGLNVPRELIPNNYRWQYIQRIKTGIVRTGSKVKRRYHDDSLDSSKVRRHFNNDYSALLRNNPYIQNNHYQEEEESGSEGGEDERSEVQGGREDDEESLNFKNSDNHRRRKHTSHIWDNENFDTRYSKQRKNRTEIAPSRLARTRVVKKRRKHASHI